ncbi:MAG: hypothetical protein ACAF41_19935 [Leptolyngbya sp. BL-A-14]
MNKNNFRTLFVKTAGFLGVAGLSVLISLPGLSQQSPDNTSPNVPSTVKPTNPGGQDAGTTNGGENLNRVPNNGSTMQQNNSTGQPAGTGGDNADPTSKPGPVNRVEGQDQNRGNTSPSDSSTQSQPSGSYSQPGANQPGSTNGGDSSQQVEQNRNGGSVNQQNQTTPGGRYQTSPQPRTQSDTNSGSTTDGTTSQQQPSNGGVRALW